MNRIVRFLAATAFVAAMLSFVSASPVHAACTLLDSSGPFSTVLVDTPIGHSITVTYFNSDGTVFTDFPQTSTSTENPTEFQVAPPLRLVIVDNDANNCSGPVTTFSPGDARLDPRPGDRLAVYCNPAEGDTPAAIDVLGILSNSQGKELINPTVSDVAGKWSSFPDGMGGTVSIGGTGSTLAIQWFNSTVGANGAGDFAKTVTCASWSQR